MREYRAHIPQTIGELHDLIGSMMLSSPRFEDHSGYFPGKNIDTEFFALTEGFKVLRKQLGEERYHALVQMADSMRAHFEADPDDKTEDAIRGREIVLDMEDVLAPLEAEEHEDSDGLS